MKFGKLSDISTVDFQLPTDNGDNERLLKKHPINDAPTLYVGCTGWGMKEWVGTVYPKGAKAKEFLSYYTKQFNTIELNTTHYRIPTVETITKWKAVATADFHFCPKIPQPISHSRDLGLSKDQILLFCEAIQGLEAQLGYSFMQLPPYFGYDRLGILEKFLHFFPKTIPLAIEVRHESWFSNSAHLADLTDLLQEQNTTFVITDVAGRRDVLHQKLTQPVTMVRFVGNNLHPTDYQRIDEWIVQLNTWFENGLQSAYLFTHEPDNLKAPELAEYVVQQAQQLIPNIKTRGPKLNNTTNGQMSLF